MESNYRDGPTGHTNGCTYISIACNELKSLVIYTSAQSGYHTVVTEDFPSRLVPTSITSLLQSDCS